MLRALNRRRAAFALLVATAPLVGCTESTAIDNTLPPGVLIISMTTTSTVVSTYVVEVTAPDIATPLVFNLQSVNGTATGTLTIPAGSSRTILCRAFDDNAVETHRGSRTMDIRSGTNNPQVSITMSALTGDQPVQVNIGSNTVSVSPSTSNVAVGATVALGATVRDAFNNVVPTAPGDVKWATSNPALATVSSTGVVSGVKAGSVTITATYNGAGGQATVTVQ